MSADPLTSAPISLVLAIDVRLYREGLARALPADRVAVTGAANCRADARIAVNRLRPDIVLIDVAMPEAFELMRETRVDSPDTHVIAFAVDGDVHSIVQCAEAGAAGYVLASASIDDLVSALETAVAGELVCSPRVAAELFRRMGTHQARAHLESTQPAMLTNRERQVLTLLRECLSNKEIATALHISEATVKNHVHHLLEKLQVTSRAEAATCLPAVRQFSRTRTVAI